MSQSCVSTIFESIIVNYVLLKINEEEIRMILEEDDSNSIYEDEKNRHDKKDHVEVVSRNLEHIFHQEYNKIRYKA